MKAIIFALSMAVFPFAAQAGEAIAYVVDGKTFEGYRSAAKGDSKGLVLVIHDWDGLTAGDLRHGVLVHQAEAEGVLWSCVLN